MKVTTLLIFAFLMQVSAAGLAQKITLNERNASLESVMDKIRSQTGYEFVFNVKDIDNAKRVNVSFKAKELNEALEELFENQALSYSVKDKFIVVKPKEKSFFERVVERFDVIDIRGLVRNERGEALEGITVMVKGAKIGTRTNAKGEFVLKGVKKGDILVFTGVAIEPFEYTVKDDKNIDLNLKARLVQLEEVGINTGYQKISKERFVGSYSQLDSAAFHRRAGMGILERLDGTVTGVLFDKKGGRVGGYANPIQIRGISTINSDPNPLIIVDNFPYSLDLSTINPNDVENVVVLKDAAAASVWGARAGNGVIVITTKKGKFNQPLSVYWNSNVNIQAKPDLFHYPQMTTSESIDVEQFLFSNGYYDNLLNSPSMPAVSPVVEILDKIKRGLKPEADGLNEIDKMRNFDIRDQLNKYVYQKRINQQHHLNFTAGSSRINYQFSVGYNATKPEIINNKTDNQYSLTSNVSYKIGRRIDVSTGINFNYSKKRSIQLPTFRAYPYAQLADNNGNTQSIPLMYRSSYLDTIGGGRLLDWHFRPLDEIKNADVKNIAKAATFNAKISYKVNQSINIAFFSQYTLQDGSSSDYMSLKTYTARDLINKYTNFNFSEARLRYPVPLGGILDIGNSNTNSYNFRGQATFNKTWNSHTISSLLAGDISQTSSSYNRSRFYGYNPEYGTFESSIDYVNQYNVFPPLGASSLIPNNTNILGPEISRIVSLTGNLAYTYKDRYSVYSSARRDGSNLFGVITNNKWKPLWSIGASWQINNEKFFKTNWINKLTLRTSYGYLGNVNNSVSGLPTILYSSTPAVLTSFRYAYPGTPPNPNLRWEEVNIVNFGLDYTIFKSRVTGSVEYYRKKSTDLISRIPFAPTTGITSYPVNAASIKGDGIELKLGGKIFEQNLVWQANFGLSYAKMKVTDVYNPQLYTSLFTNAGLNPAKGRIAFGLSSYRWAGLDPQTGDPQGILQGNISKDYSAIGTDSVDNQVFHGSSIPLYSGFLSNNISWKQFSLSFNINYRLGFYFRRPTLSYQSLFSYGIGTADYARRWKKTGDEMHTNVPSMIYPLPMNSRDDFYQNSEINVLRGDNIRLQDVRIQYEPKAANLLGIKNFSLFAYLNNLNLILWRHNDSNLDPDFAGTGALVTPTPKYLSFGLNVSF